MKLATAAQMREMDRRAIEEFAVPSILLMENAALQIADAVAQRHGRAKTFAAVCGTGNNGGDGMAVARHLTSRYDYRGVIWLCAEPGSDHKPSPDVDANRAMAEKFGIAVRRTDDPEFEPELSRADIVLDALLGTGAHGDPRPAFASAIHAIMQHAQGKVVAIDIPSGVDADTGVVYDPAITAEMTVTLGVSKIGLHLAPAYGHTGQIVVGDLCYPPQILAAHAGLTATALLTDKKDVAEWIPLRIQTRDSNKSTYGSVALFAGSQGFAGAATLCCLGAARAGGGLVTLGVPEGLLDVMMARVPDVIMTRGFLDTGGRQFRRAAVEQALKFVEKMDAVGLGPGLSTEGAEVQGFVLDFIRQCPKPMVIDADALTILAHSADDHGASILKSRTAPTIITPHPGEMARLLGSSSKEVQADRLGSVRRAAETFHCVALLKGDRTLIAVPDGRLAINATGNAGMASGGMGDVLTGITTTLLAQIHDPFRAAAAAAYVHGLAGDLASQTHGKPGLMASDLAEFVPDAITRCLAEVTK